MNSEEKKEFDYEDYFFCKYSSDFTDLFLKVKEIADGYCVNIFNLLRYVIPCAPFYFPYIYNHIDLCSSCEKCLFGFPNLDSYCAIAMRKGNYRTDTNIRTRQQFPYHRNAIRLDTGSGYIELF